MKGKNWIARYGALAASALMASRASAIGHLDVDDASTLDPGQCQYEAWYGRAGSVPVNAFHFGPACGIGPVQLGLNVDRYSSGGAHVFTVGPQIKWTWLGHGGDAPLSAAISAAITYDRTSRGRSGRQFVVPVTWRAASRLLVHVNVGADRSPVSSTRTSRFGVGGDWAMTDKLSLIAERNRAGGVWLTRAGVRYSFTPAINVDATVSRTGPDAARGFYVGLHHEFAGL
jgi:hypothetical protein